MQCMQVFCCPKSLFFGKIRCTKDIAGTQFIAKFGCVGVLCNESARTGQGTPKARIEDALEAQTLEQCERSVNFAAPFGLISAGRYNALHIYYGDVPMTETNGVLVPRKPDPAPLPSLDDPSLYINRELSWLAFNRRVLEEALDPAVPLLERIKFLAIFAANLDEFFMVRVGGLQQKVSAGVNVGSGADRMPPREQLAAISTMVRELFASGYQCLREQLLPAL